MHPIQLFTICLAFCLCFAVTLSGVFPPVAAQSHGHHAPYAGQQARDIKSLSAADIAEIQSGGGWGLAKPAELNGLPGPKHLLELRREIHLTDAQVRSVETLFNRMRKQAIAEGQILLQHERALDRLFSDGTASEDALMIILEQAARSRQRLRFIHLAAHLETPKILTQHQMQRYTMLRGYTSDPCARVPEGHDPELWKRHNGCN